MFCCQKLFSDNDVKGLRKILDQVECSVRNLRTLKVETSCYGSLLVPLVNEKLPNELRVNIAKSFANDIWDIDIMINFLKKEVEAKERSFAVGMSFDLDDDIKNSSDVFHHRHCIHKINTAAENQKFNIVYFVIRTTIRRTGVLKLQTRRQEKI